MPTVNSEQIRNLGNRGYSVAMRILCHNEDAADAVQDAFQQLFKRGDQFDANRGTVQAWFLKIVRNRSLDMKKRKKPTTENESPVVDPRNQAPDDHAEKNEQVQLVRQKLKELKPDEYEIIMLRDFHNMSYSEISTVLQIASGTVMSRLHRARQQLRQKVLQNHASLLGSENNRLDDESAGVPGKGIEP